MKYCGIDLKGNEAIVICIEENDGDYDIIAPEIKKIKLNDSNLQEDVRLFAKTLNDFFVAMNFDKIAIKERGKKGKFAGGPVSFKMEGIIHSLDFKIELIHGATAKSKIKNMDVDLSIVNKYQVEALKVALSLTID